MANPEGVKLSIIILSWNTRQLLRRCLKSLIYNCEVIAVDNGSIDRSTEMIKKEFSEIKLISNKENLGFARGNNQGIKIAQGEYIMLLNSDTIVQKGAMEKLVKFLDENPKVAAVSPLLLNPDGSPQIDYYMRFPNVWQILLYHNPVLRPLVMGTPLSWLVVNKTNKTDRSNEPFGVDQLPGAALIARKEIWDKVGPLNEDYHFLFEDVDWCWRAKKLGFKLMVVPAARIIHIGGASWKKKLKEKDNKFYKQFFSSMLLFIKKNYGDLKFKLFRAALVVHFLLTFKLQLAFYFLKTEGKQKELWG